MKRFPQDNRGVALLTVIMVMIIGLVLAALCFYLIGQGNKTYRMSKNYAKAFNLAQGGIEEAIKEIERDEISEDQLGNEQTATSGAKYRVWRVFSKILSRTGGLGFAPVSEAYKGFSTTANYYLIHSQATVGNARADLYVIKGY